MKRRRTMLLAVTATSMAAAIACTPDPGQPMGKVGRPDYAPPPDVEAGTEDAGDASMAPVGDVAMTPDAAPPKDVRDAGATPKKPDASAPKVGSPADLHPDWVGTTATVDDRGAQPAVGTTARVNDTKK
jgi:hypothetical protein